VVSKLILDDVFQFFKDGSWHGVEEVQVKFGIDRGSAKQIIDFLTASGFLSFDEKKDSAIIHPHIQRILNDEF